MTVSSWSSAAAAASAVRATTAGTRKKESGAGEWDECINGRDLLGPAEVIRI